MNDTCTRLRRAGALACFAAAVYATAALDASSLEGIADIERSQLAVELEAARGLDLEIAHPSSSERAELGELVERTLAAAEPGVYAALWRRRGFELREVEEGLWLIVEAAGERRGQGAFAFRTNPRIDALLAAPHGLPSDDRLTAEIVTRLFSDHPLRAAAWSTVPRREVDLTHTDSTAFQAFTTAFAVAFPTASVVQIHGFAAAKRKTEEGRAAAAILSNGTREPDPALRERAACLDAAVSPSRVFPDVPELGATTNDQGQALRDLGVGRFLHVELSFPTRERLAVEGELLDAVAQCLLEESG